MKIIQVTWIDAIGDDGWISIDAIKKEKPTAHHSLGYLVHETKQSITITMSHDEENDNLGGWLCIPKKYIVEVKELAIKRK